MIVYKFGGALARSKRGLSALVKIVREASRAESARARRAKKSGALHGVVLVTSAIGHTTRYLARAAELAEEGKLRDAEEHVGRIIAQHGQLARSLELRNEARLLDQFETIANEIGALLEGVAIVKELSPRTRDAILAAGERLATALVHALLEDEEIPARSVPSSQVIITDEQFGSAIPMMSEIARRAEKQIVPQLRRGAVVVMEGFSGATLDGIPTTMGSESSDLTATLLAGAMGAKEVVIWKTLPGLYTADPEFVKVPKLIRSMNFDEAEELGRRGARILFPTFAHPLAERDTVLRIGTPFSLAGKHTVLSRDLPVITAGKSDKPLALAMEQHLIPFTISLREKDLELAEVRRVSRYQWESSEELSVLIRREDRRHMLRLLADREIAGSEGASLTAISLIVRRSSTKDPSLVAGIAKSLRAISVEAIMPLQRSIIVIVDDREAIAALRKLHRDLFEL